MPGPSFRRDVAKAIGKRRRLLRALALALVGVLALGVLRPGARQGQRVLIAARDLPAGLTLEAADLASRVIPGDLLPQGALRPGAAILGRTITSAARKGEVFTDARILAPGLLAGAGGLVVAPIRIADPGSVALLRAGDRVDVLAASSTGDSSSVVTIVSAALVLAVPIRRPGDSGPATDTSFGASDGSLVVLAVKPDVASLLAKAALESRLSVTVVG